MSARAQLGCFKAALAATSLLLGAGQATAQPSAPEPAEPASAAAHVALARQIAGHDLAGIADGFLCKSPAAGSAYLKAMVQAAGPGAREPGRAFDNLYYVGLTFVGSWILKTDQGLIVWDALNNEAEARTILIPGMRKLGLDPAQIKYLIVTHGHYDHFGGALYLQKTYGVPVLMSAADWDFIYDDAARERAHLPFVPPPARDRVIREGDRLTLGNTTIRFMLTPGHTPGTVSSIFNVQDHGVERRVGMWGGTAMPKTSAGLSQYHDSFHRFWDASVAAGTVAAVSTHAFVAGNFEAFDRQKAGARDPFLLGADGYRRFMSIYDECITAQGARYAAWGW